MGTERQLRVAIRIEGTAQDVGCRLFVYRLATGRSFGGLVGNRRRGVFAEVGSFVQ